MCGLSGTNLGLLPNSGPAVDVYVLNESKSNFGDQLFRENVALKCLDKVHDLMSSR